MPDTLAVVLRPKGRFRIPSAMAEPSSEGWSELAVRWRVVELWTVPVGELLATEDPGMMPWALLSQFEGPPEPGARRCRIVIDRVRDAGEHANLLAVSQVLSRLRYNDPRLLTILGGSRIMIESPLLRELREEWTAEARAEARAEDILRFLEYRFGPIPEAARDAVRATQDPQRLDALLECAARCENLDEFDARLRLA